MKMPNSRQKTESKNFLDMFSLVDFTFPPIATVKSMQNTPKTMPAVIVRSGAITDTKEQTTQSPTRPTIQNSKEDLMPIQTTPLFDLILKKISNKK